MQIFPKNFLVAHHAGKKRTESKSLPAKCTLSTDVCWRTNCTESIHQWYEVALNFCRFNLLRFLPFYFPWSTTIVPIKIKFSPQKFTPLRKLHIQTSHVESCWSNLFKTSLQIKWWSWSWYPTSAAADDWLLCSEIKKYEKYFQINANFWKLQKLILSSKNICLSQSLKLVLAKYTNTDLQNKTLPCKTILC